MDNSAKNSTRGDWQEETNNRIAEVAKPEDIPGLSKTHQYYFTQMGKEPNAKKRIALVKEMKSKLREEAGDRIREKL